MSHAEHLERQLQQTAKTIVCRGRVIVVLRRHELRRVVVLAHNQIGGEDDRR
jgi:hypothetical protein